MLRGLLCALVLVGAGLAVAGLSGCGAVFVWVPQTYTVRVTATVGNVHQATAITLNVHSS
jgi:hypothetical protein